MSDIVKELREVTSARWRELVLRAAAELEVQALKLRSVEEELVAANQRCHDLIRGGEKILTERDSYALRLGRAIKVLQALGHPLAAINIWLESDGEIVVDRQERDPYRDAPINGPGSRLHDQLKEIKRGDG